MARYLMNVGVTYWINADSEADAESKIESMVLQDYGRAFFENAWYTPAELSWEEE